MIRKILVRDYLKGYGDMTAEERKAFVGRVGEWLVRDGMRLLTQTDRPMARSQNLMTITTRWTAEDAKAVTDGIMLMSALVGVADTWLPTQIYMKSAYRAVRQVVAVLTDFAKGNVNGLDLLVNPATGAPMPKTNNTTTSGRGAAAPYNHEPKRAAGAGAGKPQALPAAAVAKRSTKNTETTEKVGSEVAGIIQPSAISHQPSSAVVPARPKHIDQYVHLLPKETQERAGQYGELMQQLGEARNNMQLLMDDNHASAKSREQWAKQATKIDKKIRAIRDELDREWEKVAESGRVRTDAFGNAFLVPDGESPEMADDGEAHETLNLKPETCELTSEQKKRRRELRKWLIDLRRGKEGKNREKRIELWRVNWKEYLTLEPKEKALEDEKILEAARHFGIDIGKDTTEHGTDGDGVKNETDDDGAKGKNAETGK